jgi:tRNA(fMet)-specific endonuclease VapC
MIRGRIPDPAEHFRNLHLSISSITFAELEYGVHRSSDPAQNAAALRRFCAGIEIRPFDSPAASVYGRIRAELASIGTPIGPLDTLIAAHAIALNALLITSNVKEFRRVPGLRLEPDKTEVVKEQKPEWSEAQ